MQDEEEEEYEVECKMKKKRNEEKEEYGVTTERSEFKIHTNTSQQNNKQRYGEKKGTGEEMEETEVMRRVMKKKEKRG